MAQRRWRLVRIIERTNQHTAGSTLKQATGPTFMSATSLITILSVFVSSLASFLQWGSSWPKSNIRWRYLPLGGQFSSGQRKTAAQGDHQADPDNDCSSPVCDAPGAQQQYSLFVFEDWCTICTLPELGRYLQISYLFLGLCRRSLALPHDGRLSEQVLTYLTFRL